jgi:aspartate 1-decarboxylase
MVTKEDPGSVLPEPQMSDKVGLLPYERILCGNMANGERFETDMLFLRRLAPDCFRTQLFGHSV